MYKASVLYVGSLGEEWQNSRKHWEILKKLCITANCVDLDHETRLNQRRWLRRIDGRAFTQKNTAKAGKKVLDAAIRFQPNIIWFEKPLIFDSDLLLKVRELLPSAYLVCRQDDNPFGTRDNEKPFWKRFISAIPYYDLHLVKRESDRSNFEVSGAKKVSYFWSGFDSRYFYPPDEGYPKKDIAFSFIGANMDGRDKFIHDLAVRLNVTNFFVGGQNWKNSLLNSAFPRQVHNKITNDSELRNIFLRSSVCLGLYSTSNKDEFSGRAFMIAGCGGTLVAPRSKMHDFFFRDGVEALFFDNIDECAGIIKEVISRPSYGESVGRYAAIRSYQDGYSLESRISSALDEITKAMN